MEPDSAPGPFEHTLRVTLSPRGQGLGSLLGYAALEVSVAESQVPDPGACARVPAVQNGHNLCPERPLCGPQGHQASPCLTLHPCSRDRPPVLAGARRTVQG